MTHPLEASGPLVNFRKSCTVGSNGRQCTEYNVMDGWDEVERTCIGKKRRED